MMFGVKADRSPDDHDPGNLSPPSRGHTHRMFAGGEFKWTLHPKLNPSVYFVKSKDRSVRTSDPQTGEVHIYEPTFVGYGFSGSILPRLSYFSEAVRAYGSTTSQSQATDETRVNALAYDVGMRLRIPGPYQASLTYERMFASGDEDRQSTVNSTLLGNRAGDDEVWRGFGGLSLGYAFAPTFGNLKVRKATLGFSPFTQVKTKKYQGMRIDVDAYEYRKEQIPGAFGDLAFPTGGNSREKLGSEVDLQLSWQWFDDLRWQVRWGKFWPGPAYRPSVTLPHGSFNLEQGDPEIYWKFQWTLDI